MGSLMVVLPSMFSATVFEVTFASLTVSALRSSYEVLLFLLVIKIPSPSALMVAPSILASDARIYTPVPAEVMLPPVISRVVALLACTAAPLALVCVMVAFVRLRAALLVPWMVLIVPAELTELSDRFRVEPSSVAVFPATTFIWPCARVIVLPSSTFSVLPCCTCALLLLAASTMVPSSVASEPVYNVITPKLPSIVSVLSVNVSVLPSAAEIPWV